MEKKQNSQAQKFQLIERAQQKTKLVEKRSIQCAEGKFIPICCHIKISI
jgi:hypothetical protein